MKRKIKGTLLLNRSTLKELMTIDDYIDGIEEAFALHGKDKSFGVDMIHGNTPGDLEFHIKVGGLEYTQKKYYGLKINGSSFQNMSKYNLPNILGAILLFDGETGFPLAIIDSIEPTINRTGAGTAVALKYLARKNSSTLTICGCGTQGKIQLECALKVLPISEVYAYDKIFALAEKFAEEQAEKFAITIHPIKENEIKPSTLQSDVIITCTPSKSPYIFADYIAEGTTIAAIGADSPDKQEIDEAILGKGKVVVDILKQCERAGELHHAIDKNIITTKDVYSEIGNIVAGQKEGRQNEEEIIIYDATGTALQDVAAAAICYEKAIKQNDGTIFSFFN